ncbi:hypothetical protein [Streptomyces litchfieldiae]|uniref:Integral membrane protein n=1 Tax=Streptomyces litchfieldiae TaxID=3075543 RepID=A0ABU2MJP4_9ACTN|nr:hypothetical protein [Streptomyces sp. DSM 44938]MDT0341701.1 hypothetical protein [Streptomyces sp. DSM 44938]
MSTSHPQIQPDGAPDDEPRPEPIRFYGTSWVDHTGGYAARRAGLALGTALLAVAGALVLWFGYAGLYNSGTAGWLRGLVVVAFTLCTVMSFTRTWSGYARPRPADAVDESAFRSIKVVGFIGVLLAYALRTVMEAPGEKLRRWEYEAAIERHRRRTSRRSGHPARRRKGKRS